MKHSHITADFEKLDESARDGQFDTDTEAIPAESEETSLGIVYSAEARKPSLYETLTFLLLCLLAGGAVWFLWTHTIHRPPLFVGVR